MDRARKGALQPLRSVVIGPPAEPADPATTSPGNEASLTRMFRMSPQDPEVNGGQPSAVPMPPQEQPTAHSGQITQRMDAVTQRTEPVTQFFSRDDLLSRGEKVGEHGLGSGAFETLRPRTSSSPFASPVELPLPMATVTPAMGVSVPPSSAPATPAPSRNGVEDSVHLPYVWAPRFKLLSGLSAPRVMMFVLIVLCSAMLYFAPVARSRHAPAGAAVTTIVSAVPAMPALTATVGAAPGAVPVNPGAASVATAPAAMATSVVETPAPKGLVAAARGTTLERAAIDAVAEGRYAAALDMYKKLVAENPGDSSYRAASRILQERVPATP